MLRMIFRTFNVSQTLGHLYFLAIVISDPLLVSFELCGFCAPLKESRQIGKKNNILWFNKCEMCVRGKIARKNICQ